MTKHRPALTHPECSIELFQSAKGWSIHIERKDGKGKIDAGPYQDEGKARVLALEMADRLTRRDTSAPRTTRWHRGRRPG